MKNLFAKQPNISLANVRTLNPKVVGSTVSIIQINRITNLSVL